MKRFPALLLLLAALSQHPGAYAQTNEALSLFGVSLSPDEASEPAADIEFRKGHACFTGEGAEQDLSKAILHFTKAAELGHAQARFNLGLCYMKGQGVEQSDADATGWFRLAAGQGIREAVYPLGICNYNLEQYVEAYAWALVAEADGDTRLKELFDTMYTEEEIADGKARFDELQGELGTKDKKSE